MSSLYLRVMELLQKDLGDIEEELAWIESLQERKRDLLIQQLEILRVQKEIRKRMEDLQNVNKRRDQME